MERANSPRKERLSMPMVTWMRRLGHIMLVAAERRRERILNQVNKRRRNKENQLKLKERISKSELRSTA